MNNDEDSNQQNENEGAALPSSHASPFMSFSPKPDVDVSRRFTQKRQPPSMAEFMTEFEQERRPSFVVRPPSVSSNHSVTSDIDQDSMASYDDIEEFSDTARLTVNASDMNGFHSNQGGNSNRDQERHTVALQLNDDLDSQQIYNTNVNSSRISFQQGRPMSRIYEPALIDPEVDQRNRKLHKLLHVDRRAFAKDVSRAIRRLSKRVVNVHNNYNPENSTAQPQQPHPHDPRPQQSPLTPSTDQEQHTLMNKKARYNGDGDESDSSSDINEAIPMTRTSSNDLKPSTNTTTPTSPLHSSNSSSNNIHQKDTKHNIQLAGNSLRLLSPTNPLRLFFAKILYYK